MAKAQCFASLRMCDIELSVVVTCCTSSSARKDSHSSLISLDSWVIFLCWARMSLTSGAAAYGRSSCSQGKNISRSTLMRAFQLKFMTKLWQSRILSFCNLLLVFVFFDFLLFKRFIVSSIIKLKRLMSLNTLLVCHRQPLIRKSRSDCGTGPCSIMVLNSARISLSTFAFSISDSTSHKLNRKLYSTS